VKIIKNVDSAAHLEVVHVFPVLSSETRHAHTSRWKIGRAARGRPSFRASGVVRRTTRRVIAYIPFVFRKIWQNLCHAVYLSGESCG